MFSRTMFFRGEYFGGLGEIDLWRYLGYEGDEEYLNFEENRDKLFFDLGAAKYGEVFRNDHFGIGDYSTDDFPCWAGMWGGDPWHDLGNPIPEKEGK